MKELVKPIRLEKQLQSTELYNECIANYCGSNFCASVNYKDFCSYNHCWGINTNSSEEYDILF